MHFVTHPNTCARVPSQRSSVDRGVGGEHPVEVLGKPAALLHGDHQKNVAFEHFQIIHFPVFYLRKVQEFNHFLIDIGDSRLFFAGISQKSAGNGLIQKPQIAVFLFHVGDIRQNRVSDQEPAVRSLRRDRILYTDHCAVPFHEAVFPGKRPLLRYDSVEKGGILLAVCRMHQLQIKVFSVIKQLVRPNAGQRT